MSVIKAYSCILLLWLTAFSGSSQQLWQYNQVAFNPYDMNVAFAGEYDAVAGSFRYRSQWTGFDGAPQSALLSVHSPIKNTRLAAGMRLQQETTGARRQGRFALSMAYRIPFLKGDFAAGLALGMQQLNIDLKQLSAPRALELAQLDFNQNAPVVDVGFVWIATRFFVGLQTEQLLGASIQRAASSQSEQTRHISAVCSFLLPLSNEWELRPIANFRSDRMVTAVWDLQALFAYRKQIWLGGGYRSNGSLLAVGQFTVDNRWRIGYSFDTSIGAKGMVQLPSHEIFLGFNLAKQWFEQRSVRYF